MVMVVQLVAYIPSATGCTIGVANGNVTVDNRPLLWKSRMWTGGNNQVVFSPGLPYDFIGVKSISGKYAMMGLNSAGLCTGNTYVVGRGNGRFMQNILRHCGTVDEVRDYIQQKLEAGTLDATGCFPFADAHGSATLFEISYSSWSIEYDTLDPDRRAQNMYGWVVRANEFHNNPNGLDDLLHPGRYQTARANVHGLVRRGLLSAASLMHGNNGTREFEFLRFGPGRALPTIAEPLVCSSMIVHGVAPGEDPALATMWAALGHANYTVAVPVWVSVPRIPLPIARGYMAARASSLCAKGDEAATQASVFPVERHLFDETEELLVGWRSSLDLAHRDMARVEARMAYDAYSLLHCLDLVQYDNQAPVVATTMTGHGRIRCFEVEANDEDGAVNTIRWDFGDGGGATGQTVWNTYATSGCYLVSCTVEDDDGVSVTDWFYCDLTRCEDTEPP